MITLSNQDRNKLTKALARAEAEALQLITTDVDGVYFVRSGENTYMVVIAKENGIVRADCQCKASEHGLTCKHVALSLRAYKNKLEAQPQELWGCLTWGCRNELTEPEALCQECQDRLDHEEFTFTEVLQPKYQRTYSWPRKSLEEIEAFEARHPEPEHTKYDESIADARRALFGD